jgi:hypothetical protein
MLVARMERELKQSQSKPIQVSAICAPRARYLSHIQPLSQPRIRFDRDPSVGRLLRVEILDVLGIAIRPDEFNSPLSPLHAGGRKSEPRQKRFVTGQIIHFGSMVSYPLYCQPSLTVMVKSQSTANRSRELSMKGFGNPLRTEPSAHKSGDLSG